MAEVIQEMKLIKKKGEGYMFQDGSAKFYLGSKEKPENGNIQACIFYLMNERVKINGYNQENVGPQGKLKSMETSINFINKTYFPLDKNR